MPIQAEQMRQHLIICRQPGTQVVAATGIRHPIWSAEWAAAGKKQIRSPLEQRAAPQERNEVEDRRGRSGALRWD